MASADKNPFTDDSDSDSAESMGTLEDIMQNGGRKKTTIKKESCYFKKWETFLLATTGMVIICTLLWDGGPQFVQKCHKITFLLIF